MMTYSMAFERWRLKHQEFESSLCCMRCCLKNKNKKQKKTLKFNILCKLEIQKYPQEPQRHAFSGSVAHSDG